MNTTDATIVRSIVLIDDDEDFLHVMKHRLQAQRQEYAPSGPVEIHTFTDPVEGLVNLPAEGICVIFLDFNMPQGTGVELMPKFLKANLGPVILLTNQNDAKIAAEAFRAGASDYVSKADATTDETRLGRAIREAVHRHRLEARNALLTRQLKLMNVELEEKNKRLTELTETAHRFVDDVAHDFRTPLTVIQQYASIVAEGLSGPVNQQQVSHLDVISDASRDLSEMVDDFLDSSKLRVRALSVDRQQHTVEELFEAVLPILEGRAQAGKISIERTIAENMSPFFADLSKVTRVLTNLAVNALKVTHQAGSLKLWSDMTDAGDVRIGVTDQGPGLKPQDLRIIFERFRQLGRPHLGASTGFGLGLSIVKQLVALNFGTIDVQSEPGKGSTFSFSLPAFDLRRILARYLQTSLSLDDAGDLWMLRIGARNETFDANLLRRLIASSSYPRDLVWLDAGSRLVRTLGISRDSDAWADRLREVAKRFEPAGVELEIKPEGPWARDSAKLLETLLECFDTRRCYA